MMAKRKKKVAEEPQSKTPIEDEALKILEVGVILLNQASGNLDKRLGDNNLAIQVATSFVCAQACLQATSNVVAAWKQLVEGAHDESAEV